MSQPVQARTGGPVKADRTNILNVKDVRLQVKVILLHVKNVFFKFKEVDF